MTLCHMNRMHLKSLVGDHEEMNVFGPIYFDKALFEIYNI